MAAAIGCWVRDTAIIENQKDVEYKKAFLNSIILTNTTLDTNTPDQRKKSIFEMAVDEKDNLKPYMWVLKG